MHIENVIFRNTASKSAKRDLDAVFSYQFNIFAKES